MLIEWQGHFRGRPSALSIPRRQRNGLLFICTITGRRQTKECLHTGCLRTGASLHLYIIRVVAYRSEIECDLLSERCVRFNMSKWGVHTTTSLCQLRTARVIFCRLALRTYFLSVAALSHAHVRTNRSIPSTLANVGR